MILMCSSMRNKSEVNSYIASFNVFSIHVFNSLMHMVLNRKNKSTYYPSQPPKKLKLLPNFKTSKHIKYLESLHDPGKFFTQVGLLLLLHWPPRSLLKESSTPGRTNFNVFRIQAVFNLSPSVTLPGVGMGNEPIVALLITWHKLFGSFWFQKAFHFGPLVFVPIGLLFKSHLPPS